MVGQLETGKKEALHPKSSSKNLRFHHRPLESLSCSQPLGQEILVDSDKRAPFRGLNWGGDMSEGRVREKKKVL